MEATYAVHLRLIGMLVADFLLVITELSSLGVSYGFVTIHTFDRQTDRQTDRQNVHSNTVRMLRSRTVKMGRFNVQLEN